jgi:hypothetical protein
VILGPFVLVTGRPASPPGPAGSLPSRLCGHAGGAFGEPGAYALQGLVKLGGGDVGVAEGAAAAVGEQIAQRRHACRLGVGCVVEDRGELEQLGADGRGAVVQRLLKGRGGISTV